MVNVRRGDGALVSSQFYTFFTSLHQLILQKKWKESLSLCRIAQVYHTYYLHSFNISLPLQCYVTHFLFFLE